MGQYGTSSCLYNHDGFNAPTETEKLFAFILKSTGAAVRALAPRERVWCASLSSRDRRTQELKRAPNALSARVNKAFKIIVSCLNVWWIGQASTGLVYLKTAVSCDKTSRCHDAIFDSVALVSWMWLWLQRFIYIQICIQADVLICWRNKTCQVSHM